MSIDAIKEYEELLAHFMRDFRTAGNLKTPNTEDALDIRAAIVGFSYHAPTEQWGRNHYEYVRQHSLNLPETPTSERAFYALCLGYLLGLFQVERITEHEFATAEAQLAGFVLLKAGTIATV